MKDSNTCIYIYVCIYVCNIYRYICIYTCIYIQNLLCLSFMILFWKIPYECLYTIYPCHTLPLNLFFVSFYSQTKIECKKWPAHHKMRRSQPKKITWEIWRSKNVNSRLSILQNTLNYLFKPHSTLNLFFTFLCP